MSSPQDKPSADRLEVILHSLGGLLLAWRGKGGDVGRWEGTQLKSEADVRAHDFLSKQLREAWPDIPIISEEDPASHSGDRPPQYWIIDPIDGTASYCQGFDGFVTQAALMEEGQPVLGVIHAPVPGLTYRCAMGNKPLCNGQPIAVAPRRDTLTLIDNYPEPRGIARRIFETLNMGAYIESGSIALKICRVADGTADLFVKDVPVWDWDLAPAHLLLETAGGVLTDFAGKPISYRGSMNKAGLVAAGAQEIADRIRLFQPTVAEAAR